MLSAVQALALGLWYAMLSWGKVASSLPANWSLAQTSLGFREEGPEDPKSSHTAMLALARGSFPLWPVHTECSECHTYCVITQSSLKMAGLFFPKGFLVIY